MTSKFKLFHRVTTLHFWLLTSCSLWYATSARQCYMLTFVWRWTHNYIYICMNTYICTYRATAITPISHYRFMHSNIGHREEYSSMYMTCMLQVDLSEHQQLKCMGTRYKQHHHCSWTRRSVQVVRVYFSLYIAGTCTQMCTHTCTYHVNYTPTHTW